MEATTRDLWRKIKRLKISAPGVVLSFEKRLARENGWSEGYTERVMEEYKRYLLLCAVAGHAVTPSDQVDQAWHLHLVYTRSYWDDLCTNILGFALHHGPTAGGEAEGTRYKEQYLSTLASYKKIFEEEPPADIWPDVEHRFKEIVFRRVNADRNWVVRKFYITSYKYPFTLFCLSILLIIFDRYFDTAFLGLLGYFLIFMSVVVTLIMFSVRRQRTGNEGTDHGCGGGGGCGTYDSDSGGDSGCGGGGCGGCGGCS